MPIWTHPYSVWQSQDEGFRGLGISHTEKSMRVYGDDPNANPVKYLFNPVGICHMMLSANEFQSGYSFKVGEFSRFSCGVKLESNGGSMSTYVVQGMGFVTGVYSGNLTPKIQSKVGFANFEAKGNTQNGLKKYVATLNDQSRWIVYSSGDFEKNDGNNITMKSQAGNGALVQVAKLGSDENAYDQGAGAYPVGAELSGNVDINSSKGSYTFSYKIAGKSQSGKVIEFYFPHHYTQTSAQPINGLELDATVKGIMKAFLVDNFTVNVDTPPNDLQFNPWVEGSGFKGYSQNALAKIREVCSNEVQNFDVIGFSDTDSMYASGKILDKGAYILYVAAFVLNDEGLAKTMLDKVKQAFNRFITNTQKAPLVYEKNWKGIVSTAGLADGNLFADYGNCFYNDHHFHYGYHIHAAALVSLVDGKYGDKSFANTAKPFVETLMRDIANPSSKDTYFPQFRSFDFYNGHSWANGLFAHGDGKDEESSSEDYHAYYGIMLWGLVTGNERLRKIALLILGIENKAMNDYFLFKNDNSIMPPNFIKNKVSGILFENKVDHATYFGMNKEYIHGIHMIPITPMSSFVRHKDFVSEEWNEMKLGELANGLADGWRGLLMLNLAIIDPQQSWNFFSADNFNGDWLDNGMSRSWSLAYIAGVGGCP
ncbi:unnamed protein product [Ambrosiozyma monospora]|uniref:glucan endo-1,3-beta-D-glucosidase n=1 Tax=Ambrosiozyma monospora TaxID=43982 RepID=A0A9W6Z0H9_AMBMO|nr:unnamed protein product [Ambrosiozyma monospora]